MRDDDLAGGSRVEPASFRDPSGTIFHSGSRVFRTVSELGRADYEFVRDLKLLRDMETEGRIVATRECSSEERDQLATATPCAYLLEHPKLEIISHPYEWPFSALKDAALFHLQLHRDLLARGVTLSDASAYNVQFVGSRPTFIDVLSLRPYRDGEFWIAHNQFCEQFLNPLLLHAVCDVEPHAWYRGRLEGITAEAIAHLLPLKSRLSLANMTHVFLPAALQARSRRSTTPQTAKQPAMKLPKQSFVRMLHQLSELIGSLSMRGASATTWQGYGAEPGYNETDRLEKRRFVEGFVKKKTPRLVVDLGCNTGDYCELALQSGAKAVVGIDGDHGAAEACYVHAKNSDFALTTLYMDLANPSPSQGWRQSERRGLDGRFRSDAVLALALIHHLILGRNVPVLDAISWVMSMGDQGVIEIPSPDDPQVQKLIRFKPQLLSRYNVAACLDAIRANGTIVREACLPDNGRHLVWFKSNPTQA